MNKFYDQYKELFLLPQSKQKSTPYVKSNYNDYPNPQFKSQQGYRQIRSYQSPKQNQLRTVFNKIADSSTRPNFELHPGQSPASKQFSNVILPRLRLYDNQKSNPIKRLHTQDNLFQKNKSMFQNQYASQKQSLNKLKHIEKQDVKFKENFSYFNANNRYKHVKQFKHRNDNIFHKEYENNHPDNTSNSNNRIKNRQNKKNQESYVQNPEQDHTSHKHVHPKNNIISPDKDLQGQFATQYQRSYSNKKLICSVKSQSIQIPAQVIESEPNPVLKVSAQNKNFKRADLKFQKKLQNQNQRQNPNQNQNLLSMLKKNKQKTLQLYQVNEFKGFKRNSHSNCDSIRNRINSKVDNSFSVAKKSDQISRNNFSCNRIQTEPAHKQGLSFSQYENQFQFINKRMADIQQFNNYYHHTVINSFKKAILRRLQTKKKQEERREKLRYLLAAQIL